MRETERWSSTTQPEMRTCPETWGSSWRLLSCEVRFKNGNFAHGVIYSRIHTVTQLLMLAPPTTSIIFNPLGLRDLLCWNGGQLGEKGQAPDFFFFWCQRSLSPCVHLAVFVLCKASGSGCLWNLRCLICLSLASCSGKVDQPFFSSCTGFFQCPSQKNSAGIHVRGQRKV